MIRKLVFLALGVISIVTVSFAQSSYGTLVGKVTDAGTGEELIGANVVVILEGNQKGGASTDINGDFTLNYGTLNSPAIINVAGNWTNNMEPDFFVEGINLVIFDGSSDQTINKENFYSFELDKSGGEMLIPLGSVNIEFFDWTAGAYHVNGGTFVANDLVDDGIYGKITVSSGKLFLSQGITSGEYIDLNGNLTITGGLMNVFGGSIPSYWPWSYDASITMSDGILDFKDQGIYIYNSTLWAFTENITGGTIRTPLSLDGNRTDFNPTGGTFELYGPDNALISAGTGSNFYNLDIYKSGTDSKFIGITEDTRMGIKATGQKSNSASLSNDIVINGDLDLQESSFNFNGHQAKVAGDVIISTNGIMTIDSIGELSLGPGSTLLCETGGIIEAFGVPNNNALITTESGYYDFTVTNSGTIRAEYALFENMNSDGINITSGGLIDPAFPLNNCTFRNGIGTSGSSLLKIDNSQVLTVNNASFPIVVGGGTCNVAKSSDIGEVTFLDPSGLFCGCTYEDDPYNRISWESSVVYNISLFALLEGPIDGAGMTTYLNDENLIPLNQPYLSAPWNYTGTESVAAIPANVVDWVLIELRDASSPSTATGGRTFVRQVGFLLKNGNIVDLDGTSSIFSNAIFNLNMYAVVYHRNHLGILSANALTPSGGNYSYDFSSGETQVYGGNLGHKDLGSGTWGMASGDCDANGNVHLIDKINVWENAAGTKGYFSTDANLNGQTDNKDKNDKVLINISRLTQIPD